MQDAPESFNVVASPHTELLRRYRLLKRMTPWAILLVLAPLLLVILAMNLHLIPDSPIPFLLSIVLGFSVGLGVDMATRRWRRSLNDLIATEDVRLVGSLIEMLGQPFGPNNTGADRRALQEIEAGTRAALIRLLPRLGEMDAPLLTGKSHAMLRQILSNGPVHDTQELTLHLAILKAFESVGDSHDLDIVERIADGRLARTLSIKQAAQECVSVLQSKQTRQEMQASLLRASDDSAAAHTQTLLRPAYDRSETPPQQLLRSSGADEAN